MARYLKITEKELQALIETAESCKAMGNDEGLVEEARQAVNAYNAVLKRNNLQVAERNMPNIKV